MAKKKHQSKKHSFKHTEPTVAAVASPARAGEAAQLSSSSRSAVAVLTRDFSYVTADLRRILVVGGSLVMAELVLWYLFGHTQLGTDVYNAIRL